MGTIHFPLWVWAPDQTWKSRPNPFSLIYRPGFEVRTYRRCKRVLAFHHFPDEAAVGDDCLVRSTDLQYSDVEAPPDPSNPIYTFLTSVKHTSYRRQEGGYEQKSMPSVDFEYSVPTVQSAVATLDDEIEEELPGGIDGTRFRWVDLDGEGATGVLSDWNGSWTYRRNLSPVNLVLQSDGKRKDSRSFRSAGNHPQVAVCKCVAIGAVDGPLRRRPT